VFYPPRMPPANALASYGRVFDTVEVNATFHALPSEETVRGWYQRTPPDFEFALKFPREITHEMLLEWPAAAGLTQRFVERARLLDDKLGPLLLQLPPSFERTDANRKVLATFLDALPTHELKLAVELRGYGWATPGLEREFRERNIAWCLVDGFTRNARVLLFPADFVSIRWNRSGRPFDSYSEIQDDRSADLDWWTGVLQALPSQVQTVYGYMANEFAGHAPASLRMLSERLGLAYVEPNQTWPQGALF
jgi:uncharacterized protein YecE (DUF72 family)